MKHTGKGPGSHHSIIRAGDRLAKLLETRYDFLKWRGPDGFKASFPILRALNGWRTLTAPLRGKDQP